MLQKCLWVLDTPGPPLPPMGGGPPCRHRRWLCVVAREAALLRHPFSPPGAPLRPSLWRTKRVISGPTPAAVG